MFFIPTLSFKIINFIICFNKDSDSFNIKFLKPPFIIGNKVEDLTGVARPCPLERADRVAEDGPHAQRAVHPEGRAKQPVHEVVRPIQVPLNLIPVITLGSFSNKHARGRVQTRQNWHKQQRRQKRQTEQIDKKTQTWQTRQTF